MKRILFFSHDASRSGAPIQLFHTVSWFKKQGFQVDCHLVYHRGELLSEFKNQFKTKGLFDDRVDTRTRWARWKAKMRLRLILSESKPDLIYVNSVASVSFLHDKLPPDIPVIFSLHEMPVMIRNYTNIDQLTRFVAGCKSIIVPSTSCKNGLHALIPQLTTPVHVIGGFPPPKTDEISGQIHPFFSRFNKIVVGIGLPSWQKGVDLFVQASRSIIQKRKDIGFLWIGTAPESASLRELVVDINKMEISSQFNFVPSVKDVRVFFGDKVIFALPSREDTFPIVSLEAGLAGCPVVCFRGAGGISDLLEDINPEGVVPYGDTEAFAACILKYVDDEELRRDAAQKWHSFVEKNHLYEAVLHRVRNVVEETLQ